MAADDVLAVVAESLGTHAFAWFAASLCGVLAVVAVLWHFAGRRLRRSDPSEQPSPLLLVLRIATGFVVIVAASAGFAEIADEIGEDGAIERFDETLAVAIGRNIEPATLSLFASVTRLGDPLTLGILCVAVAAMLVARRRIALALAWIAAIAGNGLLNQVLKLVFERVRPVHEHGLVEAQGWSFPSGHSSGSVVAYGMLAYVLIRALSPRWQMPVVLLASATAFTVASSRVFLQVHFASDVLAGFLSGTAWLAVSIASIEAGRHYRRR